MFHFGKGSEISKKTALISFPVGTISIKFAVQILDKESIPLLISIDELDRWVLFYNNTSDRRNQFETGEFAAVIRNGQHTLV